MSKSQPELFWPCEEGCYACIAPGKGLFHVRKEPPLPKEEKDD